MKEYFLVTGATSGIGLGVVESLLLAGNHVYGLGRDAGKVTHLKENNNFTFIKSDLSELTDFQTIIDEITEFSKLSGFVHCAGIEETLPISQYNTAKINNIFAVNVFSAIEILRIISKKKYSADGASIVLISSVMSELGQIGKVGYCSSKSAILGLVRSSALELAKRKIRVNAVSPGMVNTPLTENMANKLGAENLKSIENMHPLGFGEIEDIVPLVNFLLSKESRWITGQNIIIDGGYSIL